MLITQKAGNVFARSLVANEIISVKYEEAYAYCIDYVLDIILFHASLLVIGLLLHDFLNSVIYIIALVPLKMAAGGAHAKTQATCSVISYSVFLTVLFLSSRLPMNPYSAGIITLLTLIGIVVLAPVEHPNKRFSDGQKRKLKKFSMIYGTGLFILDYFVLKLFSPRYCMTIALCVFIIFINQLVGIGFNRNREDNHDAESGHMR